MTWSGVGKCSNSVIEKEFSFCPEHSLRFKASLLSAFMLFCMFGRRGRCKGLWKNCQFSLRLEVFGNPERLRIDMLSRKQRAVRAIAIKPKSNIADDILQELGEEDYIVAGDQDCLLC